MERLTRSEDFQVPGSWSPDGETLAFVEDHAESGWDVRLFDLRDRRVTPFLSSRFNEAWPELSPDGRWMAYSSNESGRFEVYVEPFPGRGAKWQVSTEGGSEPLWARDGSRLFFRSGESGERVWRVDLRADAGFSVGTPRLLFEQSGCRASGPIRSWDISVDGQRFLMTKLEERMPQPLTEMVLVQNWFDEVRRLAPVTR